MAGGRDLPRPMKIRILPLLSRETVQSGQTSGFEIRDGVLRRGNRLCVPDVDGLRQRILQEAHNAPYSVHPGVTKMYQDVKGM